MFIDVTLSKLIFKKTDSSFKINKLSNLTYDFID